MPTAPINTSVENFLNEHPELKALAFKHPDILTYLVRGYNVSKSIPMNGQGCENDDISQSIIEAIIDKKIKSFIKPEYLQAARAIEIMGNSFCSEDDTLETKVLEHVQEEIFAGAVDLSELKTRMDGLNQTLDANLSAQLNSGQTDVEYSMKQYGSPLTELSQLIYTRNVDKGWYKDLEGLEDQPFYPLLLLGRLMLQVTELAEAAEGIRKNLMDDHLPQYTMETVEMADAIIRILDHCGYRGLPIGEALIAKLEYNATRPDHLLANRAGVNGKKC